MGLLSWVNVGTVAAERDELLHHYFYDAGVSKAVVSNSRQFLLLGRKGAGKTAVFRHMERKPADLFGPDDLLVPLSLVNYSWRAHGLLASSDKAPTLSQRDSWRFVIAVESIRALSKAARVNDKRRTPSLCKAEKVLTQLFSNPVPSWGELLKEKLFTLAHLKLPRVGGNLEDMSLGGGEVTFASLEKDEGLRARLSKNIENLTSILEQLLHDALQDERVFLMFDRLDEAWDIHSIDECRKIISGLVHAADHCISEFKGRVRPIVFLREDIYLDLDLNDKNKLKEDCGSVLLWDYGTLERMLLSRINYFAKENHKGPVESIVSLFDRRVMRSRTTPTKYVLQRTFSRPRDVVAYLSKIIQCERERVPESEREKIDRLSADSIYSAEPAYSEYLVQEIKDEWGTQIPELGTYLSVIENIGTSVFSYDMFDAEIRRRLPGVDRAKVRSILRFLFDNSVVGVRVGIQWKYKCVYNSQRYSDEELLRVHPGLKRQLGLKDPTGPGSLTDDDDI